MDKGAGLRVALKNLHYLQESLNLLNSTRVASSIIASQAQICFTFLISNTNEKMRMIIKI